jgi:type II secretory pathway component GspD/PulD (secretin)
LGGTSTSTASDGIEVKMTPTFDDDTQTVTVKMNLSIKAVVAFNQLSAGNQIGSLTQPTTADHSFNDVLKLRPGQTVVVGGMTYDNIADNRGLPLFLNANSSLAHKSLTVNKQTMFIVVRPTVVRMGSLKVREEAHP